MEEQEPLPQLAQRTRHAAMVPADVTQIQEHAV
jgi:hypothetical protein